jgi:hypothetical protein
MITADLSQKIDLLPQEEYSLVEEYVERISEYVVKKQQEKAWFSIKEDLNRAEESIKNEGTISYADLRKKLGV